MSSHLEIADSIEQKVQRFAPLQSCITPLPSPFEVKAMLPLSAETASFVEQARQTARNIVSGKDLRRVLIIGPCSIHDRIAAIEYAKLLKELSLKVERTCFVVMRVYVEKPRTLTGWKGLLYDPHLDGSHDIQTGLLWTRQLMLALSNMHIPIATEFVDPMASVYFDDLISWGFIGARTSASQPHRQFASSLNIPIGFKNSTDGNLDNAICGVISAKEPHASMHIDSHGKLCALHTEGNRYSHIVLRGACEFTNYDAGSVSNAMAQLEESGQPKRLLIDCSHGNCEKRAGKQGQVFQSVLEQMAHGNQGIMGMMVESHLEGGNQSLTEDLSQLKYAVSITDPCLDWKTTEDLVHSANLLLS